MPRPTPMEITIRELVDGYKNTVDAKSGQSGPGDVVGFGGELIIRPAFQRNFIYDLKAQQAVIDTISKDYPLNVMYWGKNVDGDYEMIDGQQRTISICEYVTDQFFCSGLFGEPKPRKFHELKSHEKEAILDKYDLMIFLCKGDEDQRLDWFRTINIAGKALSDQELLNAVKRGPWTTAVKEEFGGSNTRGYRLGKRYVKGDVNRQDYVATAIRWLATAEGYKGNDAIAEYMGNHRNDTDDAAPVLAHFRKVIKWVKTTFPNYREVMKGVDWGALYNEFKDADLDADKLEAQIKVEMEDPDVTDDSGVYWYVLTDQRKHLNIRAFNARLKRVVYERQKGRCANLECPSKGKKFKLAEMHGDHIKPWSKGGKTDLANCRMLCAGCNLERGAG